MKAWADGSSTGKWAVVLDDGRTIVGLLNGNPLSSIPPTSNEAEYEAVKQAVLLQATEVFSDSLLVVSQLNRKWQIKNFRLRARALEIWGLSKGKVTFTWLPREENPAGKVLG